MLPRPWLRWKLGRDPQPSLTMAHLDLTRPLPLPWASEGLDGEFPELLLMVIVYGSQKLLVVVL